MLLACSIFVLLCQTHCGRIKPGKKKPRLEPGPEVLRLSASDDSAIRPGDKKLNEINRQNREFWKAKSKKLEKQLKRWPEFARLAAQQIECDALLYGIRSADSMEKEVDTLVEKLELVVMLTDHEQKIWRVIEQGGELLKGEMYCRELHRANVKTCKAWRADGCPSTYPEAYREGRPWRKRIQDEKCRIQKKGELAQLVEPKKSPRKKPA